MVYGNGFSGIIYSLQAWGVYDVILPFILIFTIVYAILEKTKILGTDPNQVKKYSTVVALVMALAVVGAHFTGYPAIGGKTIVTIINDFLPGVSLLLVAIVMMLLTIGLWTGKKADGSKGVGKWFTIISGIALLGILVASMGWWQLPQWLWWVVSSDVLPLVVAIIVFGVIINFITATPKSFDEKEKRRANRGKAWEEFLSGDEKK